MTIRQEGEQPAESQWLVTQEALQQARPEHQNAFFQIPQYPRPNLWAVKPQKLPTNKETRMYTPPSARKVLLNIRPNSWVADGDNLM